MKEFLQIVLERRAGEQEPMLDVQFGELGEQATLGAALEPMRLVDHQRLKVYPAKETVRRERHFVRRQHHLHFGQLALVDHVGVVAASASTRVGRPRRLVKVELVFAQQRARRRIALVDHHVDLRCPSLEFGEPVG